MIEKNDPLFACDHFKLSATAETDVMCLWIEEATINGNTASGALLCDPCYMKVVTSDNQGMTLAPLLTRFIVAPIPGVKAKG